MKHRNTTVTVAVARSSDLQQRQTYKKLFQLSMLCVVIVLFGGGSALLWHFQLGGQSTHAQSDDMSVIGSPSLSAATVDSIFRQVGSPMAGSGQLIQTISRQTNIDDAFALGVWWTETNDGEAGVGSADRNPGSVRASSGFPVAYDGYTIYPSYATAILDWFNILKNRYIAHGLTAVYAIAYPYVGTSSSPLWAGKVVALMDRYRGIAPPPPLPTPAPKPKPTVSLVKNTKPTVAIVITTYVQRQEERPLSSATPVTIQPTNSAAMLSSQLQFAMIVFGLLAAVAIALMGLMMGRKKAVPAPAQTVSLAIPFDDIADTDTTGAIPAVSMASTPLYVNEFSPLAEAAMTLSTGPATLNESTLQSRGGKFHRVTLLPSRSTTALQGETPRNTTGLLSGYRETLQR